MNNSKMIKRWFAPLFFLCATFLLWAIVFFANYSLKQNKGVLQQSSTTETQVTKENIDTCSEDGDCMIVPFSSCCGSTKRAINKKNKLVYDSHPEWQKMDDKSICNVIGMCPPDVHVNTTICEESDSLKRCKLKY